MHDEREAIREIRALSLNARNHLSHVLRNGLQNIMAAADTGRKGVMDILRDIEAKMREMGL